MKKLLYLLFLIPLCFLFGCIQSTVYDDLEVSKIETSWTEGMGPFPRKFVRTFDFKTGEVTDTCVTDSANIPEEYIHEYNNPELIVKFSEQNAHDFIKKVKSLGFYTWQESYKTDLIDDGGSKTVTVYFSDGTVKSTFIYFKDPPNYDKIQKAFEDYLGAKLYFDWDNFVSR